VSLPSCNRTAGFTKLPFGRSRAPDGGVVFVFGLATFGYARADQAGRRVAAVQLVPARR
jgi:hypothetical protein